MMKKLLFIQMISLVVVCCTPSAEPKFYGKEFDTSGPITVPDLTKKMEGQAKLEAVVTGKITSVCKAEGCWMNLENPAGEDVFVDWDHEFNVPKNIEGRKAIMSGYAFYDTTSVEELRHFAKDEGKPQEEIDRITEPKFQLAFKATGVKVL